MYGSHPGAQPTPISTSRPGAIGSSPILRLSKARERQTLCLRVGAPDEVKGFVVVDPATGWLDQICVHPDQFGAGAAEALMEAARQMSPRGIRLDVNADNERALRFYDREGFKLIGEGALSQSGRSTVVLE